MFFCRKKERFYYASMEIPSVQIDRYRGLDLTTKRSLKIAGGRMLFATVLFSICFAAILIRLFQLTVMHYETRSFKPSVLKTDFSVERHDIFDRRGRLLATSIPTTDLSVNPSLVKDPEEVARNLVRALPDQRYEDVLAKLTAGGTFRYIKRNLTPKERNDVNWLGYHFRFLNETRGEKRVYPQGALFSHMMGGVDIDNHGIAGLEKAYNSQLTDSSITLSLDVSVQDMVRQTLKKGMEKFLATGGLALVMDVNSGEVIASVSLPDYDLNLPTMDRDIKNRFNQATLGIYEFGSVFKLFNVAMALEAGDVRVSDVFDASKPIVINRKEITDYRGQNRRLMLPEVLMHSSNIASAQIALKSGYQKVRTFLGKFGFYDRLPILLPERGNTQYIQKEKWADIETATVAFGYGISVTPLHLIAAISALVNGGTYYVPTFIKDGNKGRAEYRVLPSEISEVMRHLMWATVNWDLKASNPAAPYMVGGKTGSANLIENGKYVEGKLRTSFVGAFPMNNPQYAVVVSLTDPKGIKETWNFNAAGWNAKPVGLDIIAQIAPYLKVMPVESWDQPDYIQKALQSTKEKRKR